MYVSRLRIDGFRGVPTADIRLGPRAVLVGPNGCGKSTVVDALSLVFGKHRMVRTLTEHDFTGGRPDPKTRIRIVATVSGFASDDPGRHDDWFRDGRAIPKWSDGAGAEYASPAPGRALCAHVAFAARFDHEDLEVVSRRYFHDDDGVADPFDDGAFADVPNRLLQDLGYFVLPARRTWDAVASFNSDLFRRTISNTAGIPAEEVLEQRDQLRDPDKRIEDSPKMKVLVDGLNDRLSKLIAGAPKFRLRVTAGDSDAVLQALLPHYASDFGPSLPAARHGTGLVSLQSILLLLEVGRARKEKGLPFILALEEPELHLAPGIQARLVSEAIALADQVICTTHDPEVARVFEATSTLVMSRSENRVRAEPLLGAHLSTSATNNERKLYLQNRGAVARALMYPVVLVPEGRFDAEWLNRLGRIGDPLASQVPPFGTVFGVVPTENAAVTFTVEALRRVRGKIAALVDGDAPGDQYVEDLLALPYPPETVVQWPFAWTIEDVVAWVLEAGGTPVLDDIKPAIPDCGVSTLDDLRALLKTPNDRGRRVFGLKEDAVVHDAVAAAIDRTPACRVRVLELCEALVGAALGHPGAHTTKESRSNARSTVYRFVP